MLAREDEPGEKRLVAYVIPEVGVPAPTAESLREALKEMLPDYMVPSAFVVLQALPFTPNGKLDRRGLPAPDQSAYGRHDYEAPRGEVEEELARIWQEVLRVPRVGRSDNFFELGGHSLSGMKLINAVRERFDVALAVAAIFQHPTVERMANALRVGNGNDAEKGTQVEIEEGSIALSLEIAEALNSLAPASGLTPRSGIQ